MLLGVATLQRSVPLSGHGFSVSSSPGSSVTLWAIWSSSILPQLWLTLSVRREQTVSCYIAGCFPAHENQQDQSLFSLSVVSFPSITQSHLILADSVLSPRLPLVLRFFSFVCRYLCIAPYWLQKSSDASNYAEIVSGCHYARATDMRLEGGREGSSPLLSAQRRGASNWCKMAGSVEFQTLQIWTQVTDLKWVTASTDNSLCRSK